MNIALTNLTLPSIEKRFSLTSKELGVIVASNDVAVLFVVIFISYYGDYWNKIRLIGGGGVILGELEQSEALCITCILIRIRIP